jgi:Glu-tRNA(Gln) amidotransferase subunit E-like FAD-binding protein
MDYAAVGFKAGVEIHNRLATRTKLFCEDVPYPSAAAPFVNVKRKLRTVPGELGEVDPAALFEQLKGKTFVYRVYPNSCEVETDEEPPHPVNGEALGITLLVAKMLDAKVPDEIHVMRKIVIDGSNTAGFQRTALVGMNGQLETSKGPVRISNISLEEESAGIHEQTDKGTVYKLDRLGIPLIEIGTEADIKDPEHAKEVAEKLGMIVRSTGKSQRGIGVTRQDLNVSVKGGQRVEVKGVQELDMIPKMLEIEVNRQLELLKQGKKVDKETRQAQPDGTTKFMRPLPGAGRMYPETDIPPIPISRKQLDVIKLPESWENKLARFKRMLPADLAEQVIKSEYLHLFERNVKKFDPVLLATTLTSTLKDLRRKGVPVEQVLDEQIEGALALVRDGKTAKESLPVLLELLSGDVNLTAEHAVKQAGATSLSEQELRAIVKEVFRKWPALVNERKQGALMGEVMKEVRGRVDGKMVAKVLSEELGK